MEGITHPPPPIFSPSVIPTSPLPTPATSLDGHASEPPAAPDEREVKYIAPPSEPHVNLHEGNGMWNEGDVAEWNDVAAPDSSESESESQAAAIRNVSNASQVMNGLLSRIGELRRVNQLQRVEISSLHNRLGEFQRCLCRLDYAIDIPFRRLHGGHEQSFSHPFAR